MIACTLFLPIFTAATDEKYFRIHSEIIWAREEVDTLVSLSGLFIIRACVTTGTMGFKTSSLAPGDFEGSKYY